MRCPFLAEVGARPPVEVPSAMASWRSGKDAGVVRVLGQVRRGGQEPVGGSGDGLAGDREVLQVGLGLP
jgi:hypothetical protein